MNISRNENILVLVPINFKALIDKVFHKTLNIKIL